MASILSLQKMNMDALEKVSDKGSLTMKSRAIDVNGRVYMLDEIRNRGDFGFVGLFFLDWHGCNL